MEPVVDLKTCRVGAGLGVTGKAARDSSEVLSHAMIDLINVVKLVSL